jgi:MFS family permease
MALPGRSSRPRSDRALTSALCAYGCAAMARGLLAVTVSIEVYRLTGSTLWAAAASATQTLPFVLGSPIAGALGDLHGPTRLLKASALAQLVSAGLIAAAVVASSWAGALVALLFLHIARTIDYPNTVASLPSLVDSSRLSTAATLTSSVDAGAWFIGPGLGGLLMTQFGVQPTAAAGVGLLMCATAIRLTMVEASAPQTTSSRDHRRSARGELWLGVRVMATTRTLLAPIGLIVAIEISYGAAGVALVLAAVGLFDMSAGGYGALSASVGAGAAAALVCANALVRLRRDVLVLSISVVLSGLPIAVAAAIGEPGPAVALFGVAGFGMVLSEIGLLVIAQRVSPADRTATVFGVLDSITVGSIFVGSVIVLPLISMLGLKSTLIVVAGVVPLIAAMTIPTLLRGISQGQRQLQARLPVIDLLSQQRVLRSASLASIELMAVRATPLSPIAGQAVVRQGERADAFYCIEQGEFDVHVDDGEERRHVRTIECGLAFGEIGLLHDVPRTATVTARVDGRVWRIDAADFLQAIGPGRVTGGTGVGASIRDLWTGA